MPKNKNQIGRFHTIDSLLNRWKGGYTSTKELMERCDASERTVKEDIRQMKDLYEAPIRYDRKNKGYCYTKPFEMPIDLGLSREDLSSLELAVKTLNQFSHLKAFEGLESLFYKISQAITLKLPHSSHRNHIYFEQAPHYFGTEFIEPILEAISEHQVITFAYNSFKSGSTVEHTFHPFIMKEHTNRWYTIGWLPSKKSITTFALDRILPKSLQITPKHFIPDTKFDVVKHFENAVGMTVYEDAKVEEIILNFSPLQAKYFQSKPFHNYEIIISMNEPGLTVKMNLIINYELIRILVGMGHGVRVIHPQTLIEQVKNYHLSALSQYERPTRKPFFTEVSHDKEKE